MIIIDDPTTWPGELMAALEADDVVRLLRGVEHVEQIEDDPPIAAIRRQVYDLAQAHGIAGFHCTKEPYPGCFDAGLRVLDMEAHHVEFLELLEPYLGPELTERARARLAEFAASDQRPIREGQLWFCFARNVVDDDGVEKLFRFVGGEAIYWWLWQDEEIAAVLEAVGEPVIVEAILYPSEMRPGVGQLGLGKSLISHFAEKRLGLDVALWETETYVCDSIPPKRIIAVHALEDFRERWGGR